MVGPILRHGNTAGEALHPGIVNDSTGAPLTGADDYVVKFPAGQLPPVNAFWSRAQMLLRLYQPKPDALNGTWKPPQAVKT